MRELVASCMIGQLEGYLLKPNPDPLAASASPDDFIVAHASHRASSMSDTAPETSLDAGGSAAPPKRIRSQVVIKASDDDELVKIGAPIFCVLIHTSCIA
jgi:hypothetical protein